MPDRFVELRKRATAWFEQARAAGWLEQEDQQRFDALESQAPADLFRAGSAARPLVVAFFGGTGVGKSSLLNRLAGASLARTGVERPTSCDVTVYLHQDVQLADLPADLPLENVQIVRHNIEGRRDVLWLDAPDIDSTRSENRRLALAWLARVDLLIYVVSPERYRDDVGWRVLRERGGRHGWMFVLNRWDEGDVRQAADLAAILGRAGFERPMIFRTSCARGGGVELPSPDEFEAIERTISDLLAEHGLRELERLGQKARLVELGDALDAAARRLGHDQDWDELAAALDARWTAARAALLTGLEWPLRAAAGQFAALPASRMATLVSGVTRLVSGQADAAAPASAEQSQSTGPGERRGLDPPPLWDNWAGARVAECLDALEVECCRRRIAPSPPRARMESAATKAAAIVQRHVDEQLRLALARPGGWWQRAARRVTGFLMPLLPTLALLWVAFRVVEAFYRAGAARGEYLGSNFAINAGLLVLVAWAVPFIADRLLRPSLAACAEKAMKAGLRIGLDELRETLAAALGEARSAAESNRGAKDAIAADIAGFTAPRSAQAAGPASPTVSRLVAGHSHAA